MANKKELQEQAIALGIEIENLTVEQLKEAIEAATKEPSLEEQLEVAEAKVAEIKSAIATRTAEDKAAQREEELKKRPYFEAPNGNKYRFTANAPKQLNFDGVSQKLAKVIKSKEVMIELIEGNSNLIEQIF